MPQNRTFPFADALTGYDRGLPTATGRTGPAVPRGLRSPFAGRPPGVGPAGHAHPRGPSAETPRVTPSAFPLTGVFSDPCCWILLFAVGAIIAKSGWLALLELVQLLC